jgi:hypothetical protein
VQKQFIALQNLSNLIAFGSIGKVKTWQGADVVISDKPLSVDTDSFYPQSRSVVTSFAS